MTIEEVRLLLELHDWGYKQSSNELQKKAGQEQRDELIKKLRAIPAHQALILLRRYSPTTEDFEDVLNEMGLLPTN